MRVAMGYGPRSSWRPRPRRPGQARPGLRPRRLERCRPWRLLSVRAGSGAGHEPGLDHPLVGADARPGLRDVLAVLDREVTGRAVLGFIAQARCQLRYLVDACLAGFGAARVEPAARRRADRR